ncbi:ComF family protein [Chondromyces apiculatus]|uniref:Competence protein F, phosphoribosyltransferase domain protein n=1 Tax=Chondromyces apiculatus DSM 436 TaxID=1192034 RepID=A0A017T9J4_9BACT|nr:ComF family protein [Chondromyces apiculatus]EYF05914.1 Competence protein F, phosphoribosyltransferase domain protein [Chondromyces apiculatus DSM 436]
MPLVLRALSTRALALQPLAVRALSTCALTVQPPDLRALAIGALSPPACAACDAPVPARADLCTACAATVRRDTPTPPRCPDHPPLIAHALFQGAVARVIRRFKYTSRPDLARPLGRMLLQAARDACVHADLVLPVPLHPGRLAERGYNQAALLAAEIASPLRIPLLARGLARLRPTPHQARLARLDRFSNVSDAFRARWPARIQGRAVLLVDDVATTGATLAACASALHRAGATAVTALVIARAHEEATLDLPIPPGPNDLRSSLNRIP